MAQRSWFIPIIDPLLASPKMLPRDRSNRLLDERPSDKSQLAMQINWIIISQDHLAYKYICACLVKENENQPKCRSFAAEYRNSDSIRYYADSDHNRDE
jgi:hypothetical protein